MNFHPMQGCPRMCKVLNDPFRNWKADFNSEQHWEVHFIHEMDSGLKMHEASYEFLVVVTETKKAPQFLL
jgi:hypothetical protein